MALKNENVAFVWWWTGGHIFPIKSLIQYIQSNKEINWKIWEIFWIGEKTWLENRIAGSLDRVQFLSISSGKLRRQFNLKALLQNFIDIFKICFGIFQWIYYIWKFELNIIFCKWWFVALPMVVAWWILRKKIYVHESDTVPWLTNKIASKFADKVFLGFPSVIKGGIHIWQILSNDLMWFVKEDRSLLGIDTLWMDLSKVNILVTWWSQGSKTLYSAIFDIVADKRFNFFIVWGTLNRNEIQKFKQSWNIRLFEFLDQRQMWYICSLCDVGITRWWATSLAEQKIFGMRLIIIPLPYTWWNHQYHNAIYYKEKFNDILIQQNESLHENLFKELGKLVWYKKELIDNINLDLNKELLFKHIL